MAVTTPVTLIINYASVVSTASSVATEIPGILAS